LAIAVACCLVLAAFAPVQAQQILTATTTAWLNMRTGPGTGYPVILSIPVGGQVAVYQCTTNQTWCEVGYGGRIGWSSARYLNFAGGGGAVSGDPEPQPPPVIGQVQARTTVTLNMRSGPSTAYPTIRGIPTGAIVVVNRCTNSYSWCEVSYAGTTGWSAARYLTSTAPQYGQQPIANVGALLGLRLFEFILGQIGGGQQPPPQPPGQQTPGPNEVCFYRDFDFAGPSMCVRMGQSDANLGGNWNDAISSIRVGRNAAVEVCEHDNYAGACRTVSDDIARLGGTLNDRISSFRTTGLGGGPPQTRGQACFFQDWFYQGASFCLEQGATVAFLNPPWNDRISSLRVDPGVTVEVCEDVNFGGRCERYTGDAQQLTGYRNDSMSSIRVR
jgi:uncharacterized protein YraI